MIPTMINPLTELRSRIVYGTTQGALAKEIGVSGAFLSMVLAGRKKPSAKVLQFLGIEVEKTVTYRFRKRGRTGTKRGSGNGSR